MGIVLSAIGQVKQVQLGYFKAKGNYAGETFNENLEILSLSGNIIKQKGEHLLHIHGVFGGEKKNAIGGHLIKGTVGVMAEIVILKTKIDAFRELDEETGLKLLNLE